MKKIISLMLSLCILLCAAACEKKAAAPPPEAEWRGKIIETRQFAARGEYDAAAAKLPNGVKAIIVPHHGVALSLTAQMISGLAAQSPKTVVLFAPNHFAKGPKIASTYAAFSTHDGLVLPKERGLRLLESKLLAGMDDALFREEHSIGAVVPVIARYLPDVQIIPLVFQKGAYYGDAKQVIEAVGAFSDPDTVLIASIDFSHGLPSEREPERRAKMLEYIQAFDSSAILELDETYLDAPVVLAALLQQLRTNGYDNISVFASTNAAEMLGVGRLQDTTGYLTIAFH